LKICRQPKANKFSEKEIDMVEVLVADEKLILGVVSSPNSFKRTLEIPLKNVSGARVDSFIASSWLKKLAFLTDFVPQANREGAFYEDAQYLFWEVKDANRTIVISLQSAPHEKLIVEVENPQEAIHIIENALKVPVSKGNYLIEEAGEEDVERQADIII
jgi:hypothetical protein